MMRQSAEKLRKRALYSANKKGFHKEAEDFAQDVMLLLAEKKGQKQTIDQAVIDCVRAEYGDNRTKNFEAKTALKRAAGDIDNIKHNQYQCFDELNFDSMLSALDPSHRAMFFLYFYYGLTKKEVGLCFGLTEARISQVMKEQILFLKEKRVHL